MNLCEKFYSIQGEGRFQGRHCLFLRFPLCNLKCTECDSKYSWGAGIEYDDEQIFDDVEKAEVIVITGGEPMIGESWKNIKKIIDRHPTKSYEIETNGTISLRAEDNYFLENIDILFNISPKENFAQMQTLDTEPVLLENCRHNFIVKVLFDSEADLKYAQELQKKYSIHSKNMYMQPKGIDRDTIIKTTQAFFDRIVELKYNLSFREHVLLFGNKKGV
jgi:organic radical activating enzyme